MGDAPVSVLTYHGLESLKCLFVHGPTHDGSVPSKAGRDELVKAGYADRLEGFNFLTREGVAVCVGTQWWKDKI